MRGDSWEEERAEAREAQEEGAAERDRQRGGDKERWVLHSSCSFCSGFPQLACALPFLSSPSLLKPVHIPLPFLRCPGSTDHEIRVYSVHCEEDEEDEAAAAPSAADGGKRKKASHECLRPIGSVKRVREGGALEEGMNT